MKAGTAPGEKFNIEHEGRFFEVIVPQGSRPGETLTIVGVAAPAPFNSLKDLQDAAMTKAMALNTYFKIQERASKIHETASVAQNKVLTKVSELDAKYEISKMPIVMSGTAMAKSYLDLALTKGKELDEKYKIVEQVKDFGNRVVVYAMEIDSKYCISATTARLIVSTSNNIVQTFTGAKERIAPGVEFVSKKSELVVDYVSKTKEQLFTSVSAAIPAIAAK